ncbi:MAG TPA: efflux RND transporter periplasmic adaptor subunit [Isosphaeraceae bacterium]|nr:efflux RND transporter periplasmic adaptor subunit [Isosphaeraceae bacterium]
MSPNDAPGGVGPVLPDPGLPAEPTLTRWQKFRLVVKVVELRLRFIALMAITGLVFAYWDTIWNRYDKWMRPTAEKAAVASGIEYYCPMHPNIIRSEPGHCPICGMPLAKRKKGEKMVLPEGVTARVQLAPFQIGQAGIRTAEVAYSSLTETVTAVGTVEFDERHLASIASKIRGMARVEKLYVNFTGQDVKAGEMLAELYSPELYQAIQELLLSRRSAREAPRMQSALGRSVLGDPQEMVRLAGEKLKLWGLTQAQIDQILKQGKSEYRIPIIAPIGGHIVKKNIVEGQYVAEGQALFEVADLHTVWVKAQVFEDEVGLVHVGQAVEARVEALPGQTFPGKVAFVQPHLDPVTRTVEVRYDVDNPGHRLRPGMFATVTLRTPVAETPMFRDRLASVRPASLTVEEQKVCTVTGAKLGSMGPPVPVEVEGRKLWACCEGCPPELKANPAKYLAKLAAAPKDGVLSVPESAVIDTGALKVVYVETEPGVFEGRKVILGPRSGDHFPVLEGLSPGERVAAAGAFLIDAESRINPATRGDAPAKAGSPPVAAGSVHRHGG